MTLKKLFVILTYVVVQAETNHLNLLSGLEVPHLLVRHYQQVIFMQEAIFLVDYYLRPLTYTLDILQFEAVMTLGAGVVGEIAGAAISALATPRCAYCRSNWRCYWGACISGSRS